VRHSGTDPTSFHPPTIINPFMIATMNPLAWCFNVTRLGHRAEGSTMGELATMAAPSTNTKRRTVHCSKHAFAPIASFRPKNAVAPSITLPAQRHQSSLSRAGLASESPFTGDDPVNAIDPNGLDCGLFSFACSAYDSAAGGVKTAAKDTGHFVYQHAATLSTIASGLATVAYAACAITEGVGCGVGLALSATSTALAGVNAGRDCFGGGGGCKTAAIGFGLSVVATGAGAYLEGAAEQATNWPNELSNSFFEDRQQGLIEAILNGISFLYGAGSDLWSEASAAAAALGCEVVHET
jgi:hypothetical protein